MCRGRDVRRAVLCLALAAALGVRGECATLSDMSR